MCFRNQYPQIFNKFGEYEKNACNLDFRLVLYWSCLADSRKELITMAKCEVCGKGVTFGIKVSHSHRRTNRMWKPNVKRVKAVVEGKPQHVYVCTRCLRSGKVQRAV